MNMNTMFLIPPPNLPTFPKISHTGWWSWGKLQLLLGRLLLGLILTKPFRIDLLPGAKSNSAFLFTYLSLLCKMRGGSSAQNRLKILTSTSSLLLKACALGLWHLSWLAFHMSKILWLTSATGYLNMYFFFFFSQ